MPNDFDHDNGTTTDDLLELYELSRVCAFDLFEYLRLLSEAGASAVICKVDEVPAIDTGRRVARYQLSEALLVILAALRARQRVHGGVESGALGHPDIP